VKKTSTILISLSFLWVSMLLALATWWLYLISNINEKLEALGPLAPKGPNLVKIVFWEGGAFLIFLTLLWTSLIVMYLRDRKKTKSLQAFFASMTHELKTPLASMRLQAEVIGDMAQSKNDQRLSTLSGRLLTDAKKLETQMDKILQLSRLEGGGELHPKELELTEFLDRAFHNWGEGLTLELTGDKGHAQADEFALELVIRNLLENSRIHAKAKNVRIDIQEKGDRVLLTYRDGGIFSGEKEKVGHLFYKHNSPKGSGIGLYLAKGLLERMGGSFEIETDETLSFRLALAAATGDHP
jgi:signal transduction histidine kinase